MFKTFPDVRKELKRPFEVHESCYDCVELHHGRNGWPAGKPGRCTDCLRLPDVMPGTYGQAIPPSRMKVARSRGRSRWCGTGTHRTPTGLEQSPADPCQAPGRSRADRPAAKANMQGLPGGQSRTVWRTSMSMRGTTA